MGTSPLHFAALNNHFDTCEVLLRAGISRDSRTKVDRTPLHMAAYEGHINIVELLLSNGAAVDSCDMVCNLFTHIYNKILIEFWKDLLIMFVFFFSFIIISIHGLQ